MTLEPLLEGAIRTTALIAIAALVVLALRRAPAAMRHLVWTLALIGCVAMPLASRLAPGWSLPELPAWPGRAAVISAAGTGAAPATGVSLAVARDDAVSGPAASVAAPGRELPAGSVPIRGPNAADVLRILPLVWIIGMMFLLVRHVLAWAALARVARSAAPVTDSAWQSALTRHAGRLGLRRLPALRAGPRIPVPVVSGVLRPTILLPVEASAWSPQRRDAVLLHELAHVRRFDLLTARLTQLASILHWFHPLVHLAARRQRAEAERACDDRVLDAGGRASAYASDLLEIARTAGGRTEFDLAALAMARRSQLEGRLLAILDPRVPRGAAGRVTIGVSLLVTAVTLGAIAAARPAPSPVAAEVTPRKGSSHSSIVDDGNRETRSVGWSHQDRRGSFKSRGTIRYSADLDDILGISPGGYVEIDDRSGRRRQRAILRGRAGGIERSYRIDGAEHPWDDEARAWLASFLIHVDRSSGMFAAERFPRLMSEGGPERVLREISDMTSDYGRGVYFRRLIGAGLDEATVRRAVTQAGREIASDYELARTLIEAAERHPLADAATGAAYLGATASLQSDYEHARVLLVLVERRDLAPGLVESAIASASRIGSDYERARVMIALARRGHVQAPLQSAFIRATHSLRSDYEKGRVLCALLDRGPLVDAGIGDLLHAAGTIASDYEAANVLIKFAEAVPLNDAERAAYVASAERLGSDHERGRALAALGRTFRR